MAWFKEDLHENPVLPGKISVVSGEDFPLNQSIEIMGGNEVFQSRNQPQSGIISRE